MLSFAGFPINAIRLTFPDASTLTTSPLAKPVYMRPFASMANVSGPRTFPFAKYVAFPSRSFGARLPVNGGDGASLDI